MALPARLLARLIEPKPPLEQGRRLFSNAALGALVLPLLLEQLLALAVGAADTLMVSHLGEAAVSGVSLVNMFNTVFVFLFSSMAAGGAVIISRYVGGKNRESACLAAGQLFALMAAFSLVATAAVLIFRGDIVGLLFGRAAPGVTAASLTYLGILALSYPALALQNAGIAVFRSMGDTKTPMKVSLAMNLLNIAGNAAAVFWLGAGVAGVAWASTLSRLFAAAVMTALCLRRGNAVRVRPADAVRWRPKMMKRILGVAVPNSIDNGTLQLTKIFLSSITAMFGTSQIAANGVAQSLWELSALVGLAMGPAFITVVGQCAGAKDLCAAGYYLRKLLRATLLLSGLWNLLIIAATPLLLHFYNLSAGTKELVFTLVVIHNLFCPLAFSLASPFACGLRAAGDVRFTMLVSTLSTLVFRVAVSALLGVACGLGVVGIAWGMVLDWCVKAVFFELRYRSGRWVHPDNVN